MKKLLILFITLRYLRFIQIRYQLWYRLRSFWRKVIRYKYSFFIEREAIPVTLLSWIEKPVSFAYEIFTFLNISKSYKSGKIIWNEHEFSRLWAYNLNYMDYLLQPGMDEKTGIQLIENFIQNLSENRTGLEPYPISLRGINWIKFFSITENLTQRLWKEPTALVAKKKIDSSLYTQYKILLDNIEYHLLANHLLEDGFSLLYGAFYFNEVLFYNKAKKIIEGELEEQILEDGAHFELSPMYHQIILDRLLDCINLLQNNQRFEGQEILMELMQRKAQKMLTWLNAITFSNGEIPLLNDSASGIAPTTQQLNKYAERLNLQNVNFRRVEGRNQQPEICNNMERSGNPAITFEKLSLSGYRKFTSPIYECIIDVGQIGPSYQPGHAHADTLNFVLNVNNEPVIVDSGISTYNVCDFRLTERGTAAHNTVTVLDQNSSQVWSSFRVARRAKVELLKDEKDWVMARHNGYKKLGTVHQREWKFSKTQIEIRDTLNGKIKKGKAHIWFSPIVKPLQNNHIIETGNVTLIIENADSIKLIQTRIPNGFNKFSKTYKVEIQFTAQLKTIISSL
jgi:hypothetical protein